MPNVLQITPFMYVRDLESALAFWKDMGFEPLIHASNYAYVEREGAGIRIMLSDTAKTRADAAPGNRPCAYYVDVRDVDAIHAELKPKLDAMPAGDVVGPKNQGYGQRELMILAPDGNVLVFGQEIRT